MGVTAVAAAAPPEDEERAARDHFQAASGLYLAGRYDEAILEFDQAYRLSKQPKLLFDIAQANRKANHVDEALRFYRLFLDAQRVGPFSDQARQQIEALTRLRPTVPSPPSSTAEPPPTNAAPSAPPSAPADAVTEKHQLAHAGRAAKLVALATLLGAVAGGATMIYTYTAFTDTGNSLKIVAGHTQSEADRCLPGAVSDVAQCNRMRDLATATNVLWGVTGALALASAISLGVGLYQSHGANKAERHAWQITPTFTRDGGGLAAALRF